MKYLENASAFAGLGLADAGPFYDSPSYRWGAAASSTAIGALLYTQTSWKKWGMFFGIAGALGLVGAMLFKSRPAALLYTPPPDDYYTKGGGLVFSSSTKTAQPDDGNIFYKAGKLTEEGFKGLGRIGAEGLGRLGFVPAQSWRSQTIARYGSGVLR